MSQVNELIKHFIFTNKIMDINDVCDDIKYIIKDMIVDLYFPYIIKLDKAVVADLFKYINDNTYFDYVLYEGKPYYERSHLWQSRVEKYRPEYDEDIKCTGYDKCSISKKDNIYPKFANKVEYVLGYDKVFYNSWEIKNMNMIKTIYEYDINKILLTGYKKLVINNIRCINEDHRGSDHCKIYLKFYEGVTKTDYITLNDLAIIFYQIKCHKWDKKFESYYETNVIINNEMITIEVFFCGGW